MNLKHNLSEICMPSRFHTNDNTIIIDNYDSAVDVTSLRTRANQHLSVSTEA